MLNPGLKEIVEVLIKEVLAAEICGSGSGEGSREPKKAGHHQEKVSFCIIGSLRGLWWLVFQLQVLKPKATK